MTRDAGGSSRRGFIGQAGKLGVAAAMAGGAETAHAMSASGLGPAGDVIAGDWDLSWVKRVEKATDRAVFDAVQMGDGTVLDLATRYLDNCDAVYGAAARKVVVVLNARTRAVAFALNDAAWERFGLAARYDVKERLTRSSGSETPPQAPATRNPFLEIPTNAYPGTGSIKSLISRGAIVLVCDFALGHLATSLSAKAGKSADDLHRELLTSFVPGAFAVPSGIFGMAKAQNAGCALVAS